MWISSNWKKQLFSAISGLLLPVFLLAQTAAIDSLQGLLKNVKHDSILMQLSFELSNKLVGYNVDSAEKYLEDAYILAKRKNDAYHIAYYFQKKAGLLFDLARYDESNRLFDSAILLYENIIKKEGQNTKRKQDCLFGKTDCLTGKGLLAAKEYKYYESFQYYLQGIAGIENLPGNGKNDHLATLYTDIAANYYELEQFEESLKYDKLMLAYLDSGMNMDMYVIGNLFVADDYSTLSQFDSSSGYLEKVKPIVLRLNKPGVDVRFYYIVGTLQRKKKEWASALSSFQKANDAAKKIKDDFQLVNSGEGMAAAYFNLGNLNKARELSLIVLNESYRIKVPLGQVQALQLLTEIEERSGNIDKAYRYQKQFIAISDSIKKEKTQRLMNDAEKKYQSEKKEIEILQLQKANAVKSLSLQKKSTFNYFLIGAVVALLVTGFLGYRNLQHRHKIKQQRIAELEKDRQLVAVDSLLKGQEEERSRLAKDLHDGLGGLLSGVKFSLSNMKDNLIITPDNMAVFERSLDMIDTSIKELRRVAHNMMPEMLTKFGLDEALNEYCNTINATKLLAVKYQSHGMQSRIDKSSEIIIYRIIQELLNNTLKHAEATEAFVQLIKGNDRLNIVVEDNGKGFDGAVAENSKGAGWGNIRSRVEYLKGQLDIHSEKGKGTLVNIEFNI